MSQTSPDKFHLATVQEHFKESLLGDEDVDIKNYLASYEELNKFFTLMGTIFGFVSKDLQSKMTILSEYLNDDEINFKTTKSMIIYEKENSLLHKRGYVSGSRTLLRLHRGLDFIRLFLQYINELNDNENTGYMCRVAYDKTLAKYHTFLIAKGAKLAMYALPTKQDLLKRICGEDAQLISDATTMLPHTLEVMATVYNRIEQLYTEHDLHALP